MSWQPRCRYHFDPEPFEESYSIRKEVIKGYGSVNNGGKYHNWIGKGLEDRVSRIGSDGGEKDTNGYCDK